MAEVRLGDLLAQNLQLIARHAELEKVRLASPKNKIWVRLGKSFNLYIKGHRSHNTLLQKIRLLESAGDRSLKSCPKENPILIPDVSFKTSNTITFHNSKTCAPSLGVVYAVLKFTSWRRLSLHRMVIVVWNNKAKRHNDRRITFRLTKLNIQKISEALSFAENSFAGFRILFLSFGYEDLHQSILWLGLNILTRKWENF